ncbi:MAG: FeoA family protein [Candidatus Omnitrophica bacterium]|jgi:Fe2+ transport system protein FeoA|nr:FeoA family protein [Candidatus Omnitrophota bacterium]
MEKLLNQLKPEAEGRVVEIFSQGPLRQKLLGMGIVKGTSVEVTDIAPLGDPIGIRVKGYRLSLRKEEASQILVKVNEQ